MWFESQVSRFTPDSPRIFARTGRRARFAPRKNPAFRRGHFEFPPAERRTGPRVLASPKIRRRKRHFQSAFPKFRFHVTTVKLDLVTYAISACVLFWNERDRSALKWFYVQWTSCGAGMHRGQAARSPIPTVRSGPLDISLVLQDRKVEGAGATVRRFAVYDAHLFFSEIWPLFSRTNSGLFDFLFFGASSRWRFFPNQTVTLELHSNKSEVMDILSTLFSTDNSSTCWPKLSIFSNIHRPSLHTVHLL
jgi:hypothetical protein